MWIFIWKDDSKTDACAYSTQEEAWNDFKKLPFNAFPDIIQHIEEHRDGSLTTTTMTWRRFVDHNVNP